MYFNPNSIENNDRKICQTSFICGISKLNIKSKFNLMKNYFTVLRIKQLKWKYFLVTHLKKILFYLLLYLK